MEQSLNLKAYPLDETTIGIVAEIREQQKNSQIALNALLTYFVRLHKLEGTWELAQNGRELVQPHPPLTFQPPQPTETGKPNGRDAEQIP